MYTCILVYMYTCSHVEYLVQLKRVDSSSIFFVRLVLCASGAVTQSTTIVLQVPHLKHNLCSLPAFGGGKAAKIVL